MVTSNPKKVPAPAPADDPRRRSLLDAAVTVFLRFGYRKTSMEEVARAAQVSRQGLYLHFATKEDLFRAAVRHLLEGSLERAGAALADEDLAVEDRLVRAYDEWVGRYVGLLAADAADLAEAAHALIGTIVAEFETEFVERVAKTLAVIGIGKAYKRTGLTTRQLAETLSATARGLKYSSGTREAFVRQMTVAVRALAAPLGESR